MRLSAVVLSLVLLLSMSSMPASAQFDTPSWEMGWEEDLDEGLVLNVDASRWTLRQSIEFWVSNNRPVDLTLELELDLPDDAPVEVEVDESISIGANANESFEIIVTGVGPDEIRAYAAASAFTLTLTASEASQTGSGSTQELDVDLETPRIHRLSPVLGSAPQNFDAGTWTEVEVLLHNDGNARDAVSVAEAEVRSCPQLAVTGLEEMEGVVVEPTDVGGREPVPVTLRLESSSSQQSRTCEVTISVTSEGDGTTRSMTFDIDVVASVDDDAARPTDDVGQSDATPDSDDDLLPSLGLPLVLACLLLAARRR